MLFCHTVKTPSGAGQGTKGSNSGGSFYEASTRDGCRSGCLAARRLWQFRHRRGHRVIVVVGLVNGCGLVEFQFGGPDEFIVDQLRNVQYVGQ